MTAGAHYRLEPPCAGRLILTRWLLAAVGALALWLVTAVWTLFRVLVSRIHWPGRGSGKASPSVRAALARINEERWAWFLAKARLAP